MPSANTTEALDGLTAAVSAANITLLLIILLAAAVILTWAMFSSKSSMLGFPSAIFWAITGGWSYQQSAAVWDIYYLTFFASFGMTIFSMFAAYALRTKKEEAEEGDLYFDEGGDKDVKFIDENVKGGNAEVEPDSDGEQPSRRVRDIRDRASKRRSRWM